jgi:hypothetical protein
LVEERMERELSATTTSTVALEAEEVEDVGDLDFFFFFLEEDDFRAGSTLPPREAKAPNVA